MPEAIKASAYQFAVITVSTSRSKGLAPDESGRVIKELLAGLGEVREYIIIPDGEECLKRELIRLSGDNGGAVDAIFTSGGTGFSPDDRTPEATIAVSERLVPGITEAMRLRSLEKTDRSMLSRAAAGIRGRTLIVNLPGSPRACEENLAVFLPVMGHAIETLRGNGKHE